MFECSKNSSKSNANEIVNEIQLRTADFDLPDGYSLTFTGEQQEQAVGPPRRPGYFFLPQLYNSTKDQLQLYSLSFRQLFDEYLVN